MSQQAKQLFEIATQLEGREDLNSGEKGLWQAVTTPSQILRLLAAFEAEINELKRQEQAA